MNAAQFWTIVGRAASASDLTYEQDIALQEELEQLSKAQLVAFADHFNAFFNAACIPGLWDAATIIMGECSTSKFEEFRAWLILQGKQAFEAGLKNPDDLEPFVQDTAESLRTLTLPAECYAKLTARPFPLTVKRSANTIADLRTPRSDLPAKYPKLNVAFPYLEKSLKRAAERAASPPVVVASPDGPTMTRDAFWRLIDECRPRLDYLDEVAMVSALKARLDKMQISEVASFQRHVEELMFSSYKAALWEVAIIVLDGCSDDSFDYVRGWLIAMGPRVYDAVLADPARIVEHFEPNDEPTCQTILTVAAQVFAQRSNGAVLARADLPPPVLDRKTASESQLKNRFPALWKQFRG